MAWSSLVKGPAGAVISRAQSTATRACCPFSASTTVVTGLSSRAVAFQLMRLISSPLT